MLACKRRLTTRVVSLEPCGLSQNRAEKEATVAKSCLSAQTSHQAEGSVTAMVCQLHSVMQPNGQSRAQMFTMPAALWRVAKLAVANCILSCNLRAKTRTLMEANTLLVGLTVHQPACVHIKAACCQLQWSQPEEPNI